MSSKLRKEAIKLLKAGNREEARRLLQAAIEAEPKNELTWLWYVEALSTDYERIRAWEQFLEIVPDNQKAQKALSMLRARERRVRPSETRIGRGYKAFFLACFLLIIGIFCFFVGAVFSFYTPSLNPLREPYDSLLGQYEDLRQDHDSMVSDYDRLSRQHEDLKQDHDSLVSNYNSLYRQHKDLSQKYESLVSTYNSLLIEHQSLTQDHANLVNSHNSLLSQHETLQQRYSSLQARSVQPPYIQIQGRTVHLAFEKTDHSIGRWDVPFDALEADIKRGYSSRELKSALPTVKLASDTGDTHSLVDYRPFVDPSPFTTVISNLYAESENDSAFIREVWNIVTQLTTYSKEAEETPRYPLETFLAGGGDCEDTAILLASMIKAAPVDWTVKLVYMDTNNPLDPVNPNHVMVYVSTDTSSYLIETTNKDNMLPYHNVVGWYFEVK
jgi:tetratricopeptide (TPR) repeat protein